jgi:hypothetical protein
MNRISMVSSPKRCYSLHLLTLTLSPYPSPNHQHHPRLSCRGPPFAVTFLIIFTSPAFSFSPGHSLSYLLKRRPLFHICCPTIRPSIRLQCCAPYLPCYVCFAFMRLVDCLLCLMCAYTATGRANVLSILNVEHVERREADASKYIASVKRTAATHTRRGWNVVKSSIKYKKRHTGRKTSNDSMKASSLAKVTEAVSSRSQVRPPEQELTGPAEPQ